MKMKINITAKRFLTLAERAITCVIVVIGVRTIINYADRNYPKTLSVTSTVILLGALIWYSVKYFAIPFMEGMRGETQPRGSNKNLDHISEVQ
jgi:hypothetical protein